MDKFRLKEFTSPSEKFHHSPHRAITCTCLQCNIIIIHHTEYILHAFRNRSILKSIREYDNMHSFLAFHLLSLTIRSGETEHKLIYSRIITGKIKLEHITGKRLPRHNHFLILQHLIFHRNTRAGQSISVTGITGNRCHASIHDIHLSGRPI